MYVVAGPRSRRLATEITFSSNSELVDPVYKRFPDGEAYFRIEQKLEGEVLLVQNSYPDDGLLELLALVDLIKDRGAGEVSLLVPYMGYARQDKIFNEGEALTARTMVETISAKVDRLTVVDIHAPHVLEWSDAPAENIFPAGSFADFLADTDVVLAPDKGAEERSRAVAEKLDVQWDHLEKKRLDAETVVMKPKNLEVAGRSVAIVDDIISTGGTIARAAEQLKARGATRIDAVCTHGLFIGNAFDRMRSCDGIASTSTLESDASHISIGEELSKLLIK